MYMCYRIKKKCQKKLIKYVWKNVLKIFLDCKYLYSYTYNYILCKYHF